MLNTSKLTDVLTNMNTDKKPEELLPVLMTVMLKDVSKISTTVKSETPPDLFGNLT